MVKKLMQYACIYLTLLRKLVGDMFIRGVLLHGMTCFRVSS